MSGTNIVVPVPLEEHQACPATDIYRRAGDRWSVLVVALLAGRAYRFNELRRSIEGISHRMLTLTLRTLERDGLVSRTVYPSVPPSVEYALTELGRDFRAPLLALGNWAVARQDDIKVARERYDTATPAN